MTAKVKSIGLSALGAILLSTFQFIIAINSSVDILWQVNVMQKLVGPGPILGYASNGEPLYEGTPVHMLAAYVGLGLGVLIYFLVIYFILIKMIKSNKIKGLS